MEGEDTRKRARVDEPASSSQPVTQPKPKYAAPKVKSPPVPPPPLTATSSTVPHVEDTRSGPAPLTGEVVPPNIVTDVSEIRYDEPACKDLPSHTIKASAGGTRLVKVTTQGGVEAELPLVPMKGLPYLTKNFWKATMEVTL